MRIWRVISILVCICGLFSCSVKDLSNVSDELKYQIKIVSAEISLHESMNETSKSLAKLREGFIFSVLDRYATNDGVWYKIQTNTEVVGYIFSSDSNPSIDEVSTLSNQLDIESFQIRVLANNITLYLMDNSDSTKLTTLIRGEVFNILEKQRIDDYFWYRVKTNQGIEGYIPSKIKSETRAISEIGVIDHQGNTENPLGYQVKVVDPFVYIYSNATMSSTMIGEAYFGEFYDVISRSFSPESGGSWFQIETNKGTKGYIFAHPLINPTNVNVINDPLKTTFLEFSDKKFEIIVKDALGISSKISLFDMLSLSSIEINLDVVSNISGIRHALSLQSIRFYNGRGGSRFISGTSELKDLNIRTIDFDFTSLDIGFLSYFKSIEELSFSYAADEVYDKRNLICATGVQRLTFEGSDFNFISNCESIIYLDIWNSFDSQYSNLSELETLPNLKELRLSLKNLNGANLEIIKKLEEKGVKVIYR